MTEALEAVLEAHALWQALAIFCAAYVVGTLLLLPAWIFPVAAGAAFGPAWGFAASVVSSAVASQCAFVVGRHVAKGRIERAARRHEAFQAVDKAVRKEPWKVVALLRLSPVLPSGLKSYFLGVTAVKPLAYATATAMGTLPGLAIKVYVGHEGREALATGGPLHWTLLALGAVATLGLTWLVGRGARRRLGF